MTEQTQITDRMDQLLDEFLHYLSNGKMSSNQTIRAYASDLNHFHNFIQNQTLQQIRQIETDHIRHYFASLKEEGYKNSTLVRKLASLRAFFKYLKDQKELIDESPTRRMKYPTKDQSLPTYLTEEEMSQLLNATNTDTLTGKRDRVVLELFYSTGIRVGELHQLDFRNVDMNTGTLRIQGKGDKERIVPIGEEALESMKSYIHSWEAEKEMTFQNGESALIRNKFGNRLSRRSLRRVVSKYAKKLETEKEISPHTLRHTFATHMLKNGADLRTLQKFLGHENLHTTEIYTQVSDGHLETTYNNNHPRAN